MFSTNILIFFSINCNVLLITISLRRSFPQFAQFEDAIEKGMGELLGKSLDELADAADLADAKEEASRLKAEMEATKARAG